MQIETIEVGKITPAPYNPRVSLKPGDPEWEQIARSLDQFGTVEPLVWNKRSGHLVGGHQRFEILKSRGLTHITVSVVDLPPAKEQALNIALNKIEGSWDKSKLFNVLSDLALTDEIDLAVTGFDAAELAALSSELDAQMFQPNVNPELSAKPPVTMGEVQQAKADESGRFAQSATIRDITCPHCGGVFGLGGAMGELAAKTPGLKVK